MIVVIVKDGLFDVCWHWEKEQIASYLKTNYCSEGTTLYAQTSPCAETCIHALPSILFIIKYHLFWILLFTDIAEFKMKL